MRLLILAFVLCCISACKDKAAENAAHAAEVIKEGDIIFQCSTSGQSRAIQLATHSKYSHVGIVLKKSNKWMVLEAVQPVKYTPIEAWTKRGDDGLIAIKRLKNEMLNDSIIQLMKGHGNEYLGLNYDIYFDWSNDEMYCSELVWKLYKKSAGVELCKLKKLKDFDLTNPIVKHKLESRYGNKIPYESKVVSPADIYESGLLKDVVLK